MGSTSIHVEPDFAARQKVGSTNLNFFYVEQFPVLPPSSYDRPTPWDRRTALADWLRPRVLELSYTAVDLADYAADLGWNGPPFRWDDHRRALLRAELDACFFHLYGLGREDVAYIMDSFPVVRKRDEATYGEYRTGRLILERYESMARSTAGQETYDSIDPPPADPRIVAP